MLIDELLIFIKCFFVVLDGVVFVLLKRVLRIIVFLVKLDGDR